MATFGARYHVDLHYARNTWISDVERQPFEPWGEKKFEPDQNSEPFCHKYLAIFNDEESIENTFRAYSSDIELEFYSDYDPYYWSFMNSIQQAPDIQSVSDEDMFYFMSLDIFIPFKLTLIEVDLLDPIQLLNVAANAFTE